MEKVIKRGILLVMNKWAEQGITTAQLRSLLNELDDVKMWKAARQATADKKFHEMEESGTVMKKYKESIQRIQRGGRRLHPGTRE